MEAERPTHVSPTVTFCTWQDLWQGFETYVLALGLVPGVRGVAELGGGANPIIASSTWDRIPHRVVIDISASELSKAPDGVEKRQADLCGNLPDDAGSYDLVFSQMLCEHISDAPRFHRNCLELLRPGGRAVHFFPTLYALPFVVNKLLPDAASRRALDFIQPGLRSNTGNLGKFRAHYHWCQGPVPRAIQRFVSVGFEVESWRAAFGHSYYKRVGPLHTAEQAKARVLVAHPVAHLTAFARVTLRKPA